MPFYASGLWVTPRLSSTKSRRQKGPIGGHARGVTLKNSCAHVWLASHEQGSTCLCSNATRHSSWQSLQEVAICCGTFHAGFMQKCPSYTMWSRLQRRNSNWTFCTRDVTTWSHIQSWNQFSSANFNEFLTKHRIMHYNSSVYYLQATSFVERLNRMLKLYIPLVLF